ncbi:MAG: hypothetical protein AB7V46_16155 [Thermomicrobiales bacterium]
MDLMQSLEGIDRYDERHQDHLTQAEMDRLTRNLPKPTRTSLAARARVAQPGLFAALIAVLAVIAMSLSVAISSRVW